MNNKFTIKAFVIWGICALFFLYEFFLRTVLGTFQHPLMYDLEITSVQFSLLSTTIFLLIYGLMQIPVGLIVDNIGLKKALLIGAGICAISAFGFASSSSYGSAIFYRILMGFGASFGFICMLISVQEWMPQKYTAIFIGLSQFIGTMGPMLSAGPLDSLMSTGGVNWRLIFLYLGGAGCIIAVLVALFVENNQLKPGQYIILRRPEKIKISIYRLFFRLQPWYIALLSASLYFSIEYLSENEGRMFLASKNIEPSNASYMLTVSWLGYAIGSPLWGGISDFIQRRKIVIIITSIISIISTCFVIYASNESVLYSAFFGLGLAASGQSVCFATIAEQFKKTFVAVGFGLNNALIFIISSINAPIIGSLIDGARQSAAASLYHYQNAFSIMIFLSIVSFIISVFFLKETYGKSAVDFVYLNTK